MEIDGSEHANTAASSSIIESSTTNTVSNDGTGIGGIDHASTASSSIIETNSTNTVSNDGDTDAEIYSKFLILNLTLFDVALLPSKDFGIGGPQLCMPNSQVPDLILIALPTKLTSDEKVRVTTLLAIIMNSHASKQDFLLFGGSSLAADIADAVQSTTKYQDCHLIKKTNHGINIPSSVVFISRVKTQLSFGDDDNTTCEEAVSTQAMIEACCKHSLRVVDVNEMTQLNCTIVLIEVDDMFTQLSLILSAMCFDELSILQKVRICRDGFIGGKGLASEPSSQFIIHSTSESGADLHSKDAVIVYFTNSMDEVKNNNIVFLLLTCNESFSYIVESLDWDMLKYLVIKMDNESIDYVSKKVRLLWMKRIKVDKYTTVIIFARHKSGAFEKVSRDQDDAASDVDGDYSCAGDESSGSDDLSDDDGDGDAALTNDSNSEDHEGEGSDDNGECSKEATGDSSTTYRKVASIPLIQSDEKYPLSMKMLTSILSFMSINADDRLCEINAGNLTLTRLLNVLVKKAQVVFSSKRETIWAYNYELMGFYQTHKTMRVSQLTDINSVREPIKTSLSKMYYEKNCLMQEGDLYADLDVGSELDDGSSSTFVWPSVAKSFSYEVFPFRNNQVDDRSNLPYSLIMHRHKLETVVQSLKNSKNDGNIIITSFIGGNLLEAAHDVQNVCNYYVKTKTYYVLKAFVVMTSEITKAVIRDGFDSVVKDSSLNSSDPYIVHELKGIRYKGEENDADRSVSVLARRSFIQNAQNTTNDLAFERKSQSYFISASTLESKVELKLSDVMKTLHQNASSSGGGQHDGFTDFSLNKLLVFLNVFNDDIVIDQGGGTLQLAAPFSYFSNHVHCNEPPGSSVLNIVHEYCLGPNTSVIRNSIALAQSSSMQLDSSSNVDDMDRLNNMLHGSSSDRVENGNDDSTSGSENESSPDAQESSGKRCDRQSRSSVVFNRTTTGRSKKDRSRSWNNEEDAVLRKLYPQYAGSGAIFSIIAMDETLQAIGKNRSSAAVERRCKELDLHMTTGVMSMEDSDEDVTQAVGSPSAVVNRTTEKQSNFVDSLDLDDYEVVANSSSKKRKIKKSSQTSADSDDELFDDDLATSTATSSGNATKGARKKKIIDSDDE